MHAIDSFGAPSIMAITSASHKLLRAIAQARGWGRTGQKGTEIYGLFIFPVCFILALCCCHQSVYDVIKSQWISWHKHFPPNCINWSVSALSSLIQSVLWYHSLSGLWITCNTVHLCVLLVLLWKEGNSEVEAYYWTDHRYIFSTCLKLHESVFSILLFTPMLN